MRRREEAPELRILLAALEDGAALDKHGAGRLLGIHPRNAARYIKILREQRQAYVAEWRSSGRGPYHPVVRVGARVDAPVPGHNEMLARKRTYRAARSNPYRLFLGV